MDYFNNVLTTFLGLEHASCIAVLYWVRKDFIKNILICVPKMNDGLMDLEFYKGELSL